MKAAQATTNNGLLDILEQVHAFSIQNVDLKSMKSKSTVLILIFITLDLQSVTKLFRHYTQMGSLQRTKKIHTSPLSASSIQGWCVCCFLQVPRTAAHYCMEEGGRANFIFSF